MQSVIETLGRIAFRQRRRDPVRGSTDALRHRSSGLAAVLRLAAGMVKGTPAAALQNAQVTAAGPVTRVILSVAEHDLERSFPSAAPRRAAR